MSPPSRTVLFGQALRLLGRRGKTLANFFANVRIVLGLRHNGVVFLYREALIGDGFRKGVIGLIRNALLVGWRCRSQFLLIVRQEDGQLLQGGSRRVELLVRNIFRTVGEARCRRLGLNVRRRNGKQSRGDESGGGNRSHQWSHAWSPSGCVGHLKWRISRQ